MFVLKQRLVAVCLSAGCYKSTGTVVERENRERFAPYLYVELCREITHAELVAANRTWMPPFSLNGSDCSTSSISNHQRGYL